VDAGSLADVVELTPDAAGDIGRDVGGDIGDDIGQDIGGDVGGVAVEQDDGQEEPRLSARIGGRRRRGR
jgi:hypothetical protein